MHAYASDPKAGDAALFPRTRRLVLCGNAGSLHLHASRPCCGRPRALLPLIPSRCAGSPFSAIRGGSRFFPDGRMLVTEKPRRLWLVTQAGAKTLVTGVPAVRYEGQGGLLGVYLGPDFTQDRAVYLTYAEPGGRGSGLALARATLMPGPPRLAGLARALAGISQKGAAASLAGRSPFRLTAASCS